MRKYIGPYTREEAEVLHEDGIDYYDCVYDQANWKSCKEEKCSFFGLCDLSLEFAARQSKFRIPYEKKVTFKDLSKAVRYLNKSGLVPEVPGRIDVIDKSYNELVYEIKTTIENLDDEDRSSLDPHILNVYNQINSVEKTESELFLMLPHSFLDDEMRNLTGNQLYVLLAILRHQSINGSGKNFVSNQTIARKAGVSRR